MEPDKDLKNRFTYHAPSDDQRAKYEALREVGLLMASMIESFCPTSRERSLAVTKVEEGVMWANASIARYEDDES